MQVPVWGRVLQDPPDIGVLLQAGAGHADSKATASGLYPAT